MHKFSVTG